MTQFILLLLVALVPWLAQGAVDDAEWGMLSCPFLESDDDCYAGCFCAQWEEKYRIMELDWCVPGMGHCLGECRCKRKSDAESESSSS